MVLKLIWYTIVNFNKLQTKNTNKESVLFIELVYCTVYILLKVETNLKIITTVEKLLERSVR